MYALNELAWSNMKLMSVTWEVSQAPISSLKPVASMKSWFMSVTKETSQASMPPYVALAAVSSDSHSSTAERNAARFENVVCAIANRGNSSSKRSCRTRFNRPMVGGKDQATTRRLGSEIFPAFLLAGWTPAQQFSERDAARRDFGAVKRPNSCGRVQTTRSSSSCGRTWALQLRRRGDRYKVPVCAFPPAN